MTLCRLFCASDLDNSHYAEKLSQIYSRPQNPKDFVKDGGRRRGRSRALGRSTSQRPQGWSQHRQVLKEGAGAHLLGQSRLLSEDSAVAGLGSSLGLSWEDLKPALRHFPRGDSFVFPASVWGSRGLAHLPSERHRTPRTCPS